MKTIKSLAIFVGVLFLAITCLYGFHPAAAVAAEPIVTEIDIHPESLNPKSKGKWITCIVEAPEGYTAVDIVPESILITEIGGVDTEIAASRSQITDDDEDGEDELMLKYPRTEINAVITENSLKGEVEIWIDGALDDEALFTGSDTVRVKGSKK